jgi:subtilisin family serine protease
MSAATADRLPEQIAAPFEYLRKNFGLKQIDPLFAKRRPSGPHTQEVRDRLAVIASVTQPDIGELGGFNAVSIDPKRNVNEVLKRLNRTEFIEFAEQAPARYTMETPDPGLNLQWGLRAINFFHGGPAPDTQALTVAVIDTGIDQNHPDFESSRIAYDSMGFGQSDVPGHGTHVCGIIAAKTNNGAGIAGMTNCRLAVWKVFGDTPNASGKFVADPERFLKALGAVLTSGAKVLNLSLAGPAESKAERDVIGALTSAGILVVAAMGNCFELGNPTMFPAAYETVLAVGAVGVDSRRASFSSTGTHIGICAPGVEILSLLPTRGNPFRVLTDTGSLKGTSMAAPHVSSAAALVAAGKGVTGVETGEILTRTAKKLPEMKGANFTEQHGHGLLDLKAALA